MVKFAKPILIGAGALLLCYALAVLGLNIYLQSKDLQLRICEAASAAAGPAVTIQNIHYTPWSGFSVSGISTRQVADPSLPPLFVSPSMNFRFALLPLLQGRLVVQEVVVHQPAILLRSPAPQTAPPDGAPPAVAVGVAPAPAVPSGGVEIAIPVEPADSVASRPAKVEIRRVSLRGGSAGFYDSKGALALQLEDCDVMADILPGGNLTGTFSITQAAVGRAAFPHTIKGSFTWQGGKLTIPDLAGVWAGGRLTGTFFLIPRTQFSATLAAEDVLIKKLAQDAGVSADGARGSLFGTAAMEGVPGAPASFRGEASVHLAEARFQPVDFIRQIGELMSIQELQMLELKTAEARFAIRDEKVSVDSLVLESENLVVDGSGPIQFDGKMKLRARLHLNEKLRNDLRGLLSDKFEESPREGFRFVPFAVTGGVSRPRTDLLDKLTGFRIGQDVGGLIKNLFRVPAPQKKKPETSKEAN